MAVLEVPNKRRAIESTSFIRTVYRSLLQQGRTYASFDPTIVGQLVDNLASRKIILDPMAGYGGLITLCARHKDPVSAYCIEYNPPSYLWQILTNPSNSSKLLSFIDHIYKSKKRWPSAPVRASMSNDLFPAESLEILMKLFSLINKTAKKVCSDDKEQIELSLAFLLPFVGRFATYAPGTIVHVKKGGICVYVDWHDDFEIYLVALKNLLIKSQAQVFNTKHKIVYGDCKTIKLSEKFPAMITSPPYPNQIDYYSIFAPENAFLSFLEEERIVKGLALKERLIGNPCVSVKEGAKKYTPDDVTSKTAKSFLNFVANYNGTKRQLSDIDTYYLPSLSKYFYEIETAYANITRCLDRNFEGYIIVVNNSFRKRIIPVAETIVDIWKNLGFEAEIVPEFTRELSHAGGINPSVKGLTARHMEYTIRVYRK